MNIVYKVKIFSEWHCGSGFSAGADVDSLCIKDKNNLPYIPGKSLKGLLKESAKYFYTFDKSNPEEWINFIKDCFGISAATKHKLTENKINTKSVKGNCYFSNAELTTELKKKIIKNDNNGFLYRKISSTALDNNGITKEHSLRKIEVTIPLVLFAQITNIPEKYYDNMVKCLKFVKRLGASRNRGLGRCKLSVLKEEDKHD
jgi:CRISPR/Cas system CSM-associated protein Csm3 (group 7 of RAMP superfamily)